MKEAIKYQFKPDYAVSPGEILEETLMARSIRKRDLSVRTGLSQKTINGVITGKTPVQAEIAMRLEKALVTPAEVWLNLQATYDAKMAARRK